MAPIVRFTGVSIQTQIAKKKPYQMGQQLPGYGPGRRALLSGSGLKAVLTITRQASFIVAAASKVARSIAIILCGNAARQPAHLPLR